MVSDPGLPGAVLVDAFVPKQACVSEPLYKSRLFVHKHAEEIDFPTPRLEKYKLDMRVQGLGPEGDIAGRIVALVPDQGRVNRGPGFIKIFTRNLDELEKVASTQVENFERGKRRRNAVGSLADRTGRQQARELTAWGRIR